MKKSYLLVFFLLLVICGCQEPIQFRMDYSDEMIIPSGTGLNIPLNLPTPDQQTHSETEFERQNTQANLVEKIVLEELNATISNPSGKTFSFLKDIKIYLKGEGKEAVLVAFKKDIPANIAGKLSLDVTGVNIRPHIIEPTFRLICDVVTDEMLLQDITVELELDLFVQAKSLL